MDDEALDLLLSGDLTKLSPLPKRVVRLFVSSTFTDMTLERNSLMERVYPRLKKFCRERHGLDFQVVDMRWGVRDEATDDHQTASLCSREIANCQRVSLGPNFVAFIGDKYGFRPLSNRIKSNEYCALRRSLIELDVNTDFLDTWYREDLNAIPAEYVLQPISSILKNFTNKNEPELQSIDQRIWQAIHERLHDLLLIGSKRLVSQGRMGADEQLLKYSISVTEREVIEGCLNVADAKLRCLVYSRTIVDLVHYARTFLDQLNSSISGTSSQQLNAENADSNAPNSSDQPRRDSVLRKASLKIGVDTINLATSDTHSAAGRRLERNRRLVGRYIDLSVQNNLWRVDEEAQQALGRLKFDRLRSKLNGKSLSMFKIHWNEQDGLSSKLEEHKHYLTELSEHFYSNLVKMIRNAVRHEQSKVNTSGLTGEVLQHAHYARQVGENVLGRGGELAQIRDYVLRSTGRDDAFQVRPMFIYGIGGSGKTALLARVALQAREWILADQAERPEQAGESSSGCVTPSDCNGARNRSIGWSRQPCIVLRFCCTTPASSSIVGVLTSVCLQLQYNFYQFGPLSGLTSARAADGVRPAVGDCAQFPFQPIPDDFVRLVFVFRQLIENCRHPLHKSRLFLIVLDSIERLSSSSAESNLDEKYSWLTSLSELPPNVRLIVSCSSEVATSQGSAGDDYTHLKRHFLRVYLTQWRRLDYPAAIPARSSHRGAQQGNGASSRQESGSSLSRSASHFDVLRRLIVPAIRLSRGPRRPSLQAPQGAALEPKQQRSHSVVAWPRWPRSGSNLPESHEFEAPGAAETLNSDFNGQSAHLEADLASRSNSDESRHNWPAIGLLHVHPFGLQMAKSILARRLRDKGRNLTSQQWSIVDRSFSLCSRPIFVKLALGEVLNWKSYSVQANSKGLSFGSSTLEDQYHRRLEAARKLDPREIEAKAGELDACLTLARAICCEQVDPANGELEFEWNLLSMEQQWLNFVDHCQQLELRSTESNQEAGGQQNVVFRIGQQVGSSGNKYAALSSASATQSATANTIVCRLSDSIGDAICQLFGRIELQHGYLLTKHSLSYITAARNGIGENELEDLLSLDDVVLDDVFQYHLPPIRRIPPLLWTRIRNDLPGYLNERDADGIVLNWHHNQFNQVARGRYLSERHQLIYIHSLMADYFLGKWADRPKPFECTKQQIQMAAEQLESAVQSSARDSQSRPTRASLTGSSRRLGSGSASMNPRPGVSFSVRSRLRSSDQHDQRFQWMQAKADRRVPHQPLYYLVRRGEEGRARGQGSDSDGKRAGRLQTKDPDADRPDGVGERRYNLRKLTELPHHLMHSRRFASLAKNIFFNYHWLFASLDALGLQSLFTDIQEALACLELALVEAEGAARPQDAPVAPGDSSSQGQARLASKHEADDDDDSAGELDRQSIENLIEQLNILISTLRLSASTVHLDKQMLAPQLIARLLPIVMNKPPGDESAARAEKGGSKIVQLDRYSLLHDLIAQCDRLGCHDCSLLPVDHCLQPADGLQSSLLEGHAFGIMSMEMTSDHRHLLAVSDKFLMWDISTGEIAREIDPKLGGALISRLKMGSTNEFAAALTSDNQVLVLDILTQRVAHYRVPLLNKNCSLRGLQLIDVRTAQRFLAWTETGWFVFIVDTSNGPNRGDAREALCGLSVRLDYSINLLDKLDLAGKRVLEVTIKPLQTRPRVDLALVLLADDSTRQLELRTIELLLGPAEGPGPSLLVWKQKLTCATLARAECSVDQLVYADSLGSIYLTRRRKLKWSRGKLLYPSASRFANATTAAPTNVQPACVSLPLACEAQSSLDASNTPRELDEQCEPELNEFERAVDCSRQEDELEDRIRVFKVTADGKSAAKRTKKLLARNPIAFVKLYYQDRIVVLNLLRGAAGGKCLTLPRDVRNVSIGANKCRLFALLVASRAAHKPDVDEQYLVVADSCNLLVFSVASEQLLKCIAAHSARITQLSAIKTAQPNRDSASCQLASCSMDKSVSIWNLCNLGRESRPVDRLGGPVGSICVNKQLPIAVCVSSDGHQLGLWNWQTLRLLVKLKVDDLEPHSVVEDPTRSSNHDEDELELARCSFIACKFSPEGRHLAVATTRAVHVLSTQTLSDGQRKSSKAALDELPARDIVLKAENFDCRGQTLFVKRLHRFGCQDKFSVGYVKFLDQGPSLLVILSQSNAESRGLSARSSDGSDLQPTTSSTSKPATPLVLKCFSLQNGGRLVWCLECLTPAHEKQSESKLDLAEKARGKLHSVGTGGERGLRSARLPVVTKDQQSIVVVEYAQRVRAADKDPAGSHNQLCLNIYSTRDGTLAKTIILNQVELADLLQQLAGPSLKQTSVGVEEPSRLRSNQRGARLRIDLSRATRLKATRYLDRQSVVALADEESESTYLVDVVTGQLVAYSDQWNGRASSDGRFGLTRILKSAHRAGKKGLARPGPGSSDFSRQLTPDRLGRRISAMQRFAVDDGLQVLEMRKCQPVKSLLSLAAIARAHANHSGAGRRQTPGAVDERELVSDFTRPNDQFVYYHELRSKRLLLVRLSDRQLIANYRLPVEASSIKCASDGFALLLGLSDGSLCALAIVDPQTVDSLNKLHQYPSREQTTTKRA